jgi:hypothetical protein
MRERLLEELKLLQAVHPDAQLGESWLRIPNYALPRGRFNMDHAPVVFSIPVGYPNTGPDNFFVPVTLRLKNGELAPAFNGNNNSSSGPAPIAGDWGWFSWHPQGWRPAANPAEGDNLLTFVRGIALCLRGEEA